MKGTLELDAERVHTITAPSHWAPLIIAWLDFLRSLGTATSTIKLRSYQLRRFAAEHRELDVLTITFEELTTWLASDGWSASTRRSTRSALRSFYGWLHLTGRIASDPSAQLPRIKVPPGIHRPAGELTIRRAIANSDDRVALMVRLGSVQGLRSVEIARVHTRDVFEDFVGYSLRVLGKGGRVRVIPLDDRLARDILARDEGYLFPGQIDGHLSAAYVSKLLSRALPDRTTGHMLRHRAGGRFFEGTGWDLRATQEFLGHASVATTQIYTPAQPDQMRRGIQATAG